MRKDPPQEINSQNITYVHASSRHLGQNKIAIFKLLEIKDEIIKHQLVVSSYAVANVMKNYLVTIQQGRELIRYFLGVSSSGLDFRDSLG